MARGEKGTSAGPADITVVCGCNQQLSLEACLYPVTTRRSPGFEPLAPHIGTGASGRAPFQG